MQKEKDNPKQTDSSNQQREALQTDLITAAMLARTRVTQIHREFAHSKIRNFINSSLFKTLPLT